MAHAKAVNRKKNTEDFPDSPHHTPITGDRTRNNDDYEDAPLPPPKKKKKIKPPTSLNSSINDDNESGGPSSGSQEVEIVFKLHPEMVNDGSQKEVVKAMKENATRYIKTTSRYKKIASFFI